MNGQQSNLLNVPRIRQEQTEWCWAAAADMVLDFYGQPVVTQCDLANNLFPGQNCCANPGGAACNQGVEVRDIRRLYILRNLTATRISRSVSFRRLRNEIDAGRPIEVAFFWSGGGGHVAIVRGYREDNQGRFLYVNDPLDQYQVAEVPFHRLKIAYGLGSWARTWVDIQ
jgi:hypothetical protein